MRVLCVDDDVVNNKLMDHMLSRINERSDQKFEHKICSNGVQAIRECLLSRYDLILMDIMMPEVDGVECLKAIRSIYHNNKWSTPLIAMVTACEREQASKVVKDVGVVGYIQKPIDFNVLKWWVQSAITNFSLTHMNCDKLGVE